MKKEQKHHYIPEFYLKQWAGPDGRLIEFCRRHYNQVIPRPTHPGGTGYIRGLYTMRDAPQHVADLFEDRYLSVADGIAAESLRVMLDNHMVPTGDQKIGWTRFMLSLLYRTPEGIARSSAMVKQWFEDHQLEELRKVYAELKRPEDPATPEEYMKLHGNLATSRTTIQHLMDIIESVRVREAFMAMQWHLGRIAGLKHSLLTSDRPYVMTDGIAHADSHFVMPLSPAHIFIAANTDQKVAEIKSLSSSGELAYRLNDRVVRQARKFVYAIDRSQLRFVENRLGQKVRCSPFE